MNTFIITLLTIALVVGAAVALLFSEHMSGTAIGARMMTSGVSFDEFGGYALMILLIAALASVVAWMLFGQTE